MRNAAFDAFAEEMAGKWAAEDRYIRALERYWHRFWTSKANLAEPGSICVVDERLKPSCPSS